LTFLGISAAISGTSLQAQTIPPVIYWQGGIGNLTDANYTDGALTGLAPTAADVVYVGDDGVANLTTPGTVEFFRLRIGHAETIEPGIGEVTVSNGAVLNLVGGASGTANSGLTVGNQRDGTLTIDGAGTAVTSSQLIVIGTAPGQLSRKGTIRLTNGGSLTATAGNINMGLGSNNGQPGHLLVESGTVTAMGSGAQLLIGDSNATSTFVLTEGTVQIAAAVEVATANSKVLNASSFTIAGGTFSNGIAGANNFFVGRGASTGASVNIAGGTMTVGGRFLMGAGTATGTVGNHSGGTLNVGNDLRVADAATAAAITDSTYNFSGTGVINATNGGIVGRQGTGRFFQTGGQANFTGALSIGNREAAANPATGLYKISAGELNAGAATATTALNIAPNGTGEFRVVGDDASIDVLGNFLLNNTGNGVGTLAFEFETGDSLSTINVTDAATFSLGAKLVLDASIFSPAQPSYDLLTAATIADDGLDFVAPAGWSYQIVSGGNGQILRAVNGSTPVENADFNADGTVDGADFLIWQAGFGPSGSLTSGDANNDSIVDSADLAVWTAQFGTPPTPVASVPEPAALLLEMLGLALFRPIVARLRSAGRC
jgi:hypothetical protein